MRTTTMEPWHCILVVRSYDDDVFLAREIKDRRRRAAYVRIRSSNIRPREGDETEEDREKKGGEGDEQKRERKREKRDVLKIP